ncbi:hypothetical protein FRC04_001742 [Tulasnella sp. 424]|nr:hypothetical protein FRC04_001742 [Tulasnella sp. 424]KAG8968479.1 hypothetical protein FRC05_001546 [Tulasnella sp. 425]
MSNRQSQSNIQLALDQAAKEREAADHALAQLRAQLKANTSKIASLAAELEATQNQLDNYAYNLPVVERQKLRADKRLTALRQHADKVEKELAAERRMQEYLEELQRDDEECERRLKEYLGEVLSRETEGYSDSDSDSDSNASESWSVLSNSTVSKPPARQVPRPTSPVLDLKSDHGARNALGLALAVAEDTSRQIEPAIQPKTTPHPIPSLPVHLTASTEQNSPLNPDTPSNSGRPDSHPSSPAPPPLDVPSHPKEPLSPPPQLAETACPSSAGRSTSPIQQPCQIVLKSGPSPDSLASALPHPRYASPKLPPLPEPEVSDKANPPQEGTSPQDGGSGQRTPARSSPTASPKGTRVPTPPVAPASLEQPLTFSAAQVECEEKATPRGRSSSLTSESALTTPDSSREAHIIEPTTEPPNQTGHAAVTDERIPGSNSGTPMGSPPAKMLHASPSPCDAASATQREASPAVTSQPGSPVMPAESYALPPSPHLESPSVPAGIQPPESTGDEDDSETDTDCSSALGESQEDASPNQGQEEQEDQSISEDDEEFENDGDDDDDDDETASEPELAEDDSDSSTADEEPIDDPDLGSCGGKSEGSPVPSEVEGPSLSPPDTTAKAGPAALPLKSDAHPSLPSNTPRPSPPREDPVVPVVPAASTPKDAMANKPPSQQAHQSDCEGVLLNNNYAASTPPLDLDAVHMYPPSCAPNASAHPQQRRDTSYYPRKLVTASRNRYGTCPNPNTGEEEFVLIPSTDRL